jgi:hypothetical protein
VEEQQEPQAEQHSSPWPAVVFAFLGGGLAVAGMWIRQPTIEFLACGSLLFAWYLARTSGDDAVTDEAAAGQPVVDESANGKATGENPMAKRSTQLLLLLFALVTGAVGSLRIMRGG